MSASLKTCLRTVHRNLYSSFCLAQILTKVHQSTGIGNYSSTEAHNENLVDSFSSALEKPSLKSAEKLSPKVIDKVAELIQTEFNQHSHTSLTDLVQYSKKLQHLVSVGVSLVDVEKKQGAADIIASTPYFPNIHELLTLLDELGIEDKACVINKYPYIIGENAANLRRRILFLSDHGFSREQIATIVMKYPRWLSYPKADIDARLGALQKLFTLKASELRHAATRAPKLVFLRPNLVMKSCFVLKEVHGFSSEEMKAIVINCPSVLMRSEGSLDRRLCILRTDMGLTSKQILRWPMIMNTREKIIKDRHSVLKLLNKAIYDAKEAGFISLKDLATGTDEAFCDKVAKISLQQYYEFLKTL